MQRPFRSRQTPPPPGPDDEPEVVEGTVPAADNQALVPADYYQEPQRPDRKIRRPRRRTKGLRVPRFTLFVIAIALIVSGVFFTLLNIDAVPDDLQEIWPAVSLGAAGIWAFGALIRRDATAFVAGAAIAGLSISALLHTQDVADFSETVVGVILVTLGLSVVIRGLLIRPRVARQA